MLLHLRAILDAGEVATLRDALEVADWGDGRVTAGTQSAAVKNNRQLPQDAASTRALQQIVLGGLNRHGGFFSAALPARVFPPLFNRYGDAANAFGNHIDNAIRFLPGGTGDRLRTDLSATLFLSEPASYDGGELVLEEPIGDRRIKLAAGDLLLYPSTFVHRVEPVTRGVRLASVFWIESMVRDTAQRTLLMELDSHLMRLREQLGETDPAVVGLTGTYHNLLRMWASA